MVIWFMISEVWQLSHKQYGLFFWFAYWFKVVFRMIRKDVTVEVRLLLYLSSFRVKKTLRCIQKFYLGARVEYC